MSKPNRKTYRIANLVVDQLAALPVEDLAELEQQTACAARNAQRLTSVQRKLSLCRERSFSAAAGRLRTELGLVLTALRYDLEMLGRSTGSPPRVMPTFRDVVSELQQLEDEFGEWQYRRDEGCLSVVTDPIELEGVPLGPFEVKLFLQDLAQARRQVPYCVIALNPHPAATCEQVTHPHVSNEGLCAGDASAAITAALTSGRLCEFFLLVRSVLTTYNPGSPFVSLDEWDSEPCADCGCPMSEDDRYGCDRCGLMFCDECTRMCSCCDQITCRGCLATCPVCNELVCSPCLGPCAECGEPCCLSCLEDERCPNCTESLEENDDDEDEHKEETNEQPAANAPATDHGIQTAQAT